MGSAFKNMLLSLSFCAFALLLSPGVNAIIDLLPNHSWFSVGVALLELVLAIASSGLFIFFLVKIGTAMVDLKRQYPEEKIVIGSVLFFLLLLFVLEFPTLLNKRDRILRKHDQFKPFLPPTIYAVLVSTSIILSIVFMGAIVTKLVIQKTHTNTVSTVHRSTTTNSAKTPSTNSVTVTNTNDSLDSVTPITNSAPQPSSTITTTVTNPSKYNDCFYLVKTSADCQYKTSHPLSGYDPDQDGLITYWEANQYNTDSGKADTDGDGVPDGLEISLHTDPLSTKTAILNPEKFKYDVDADGVLDTLEESLGLDNTKADTDGDGYNDGEEIYNGFDPLGPGKVQYTYDTTAEWVQATGYHQ